MKKDYYPNKSANYGIGHTRLKRVLFLAESGFKTVKENHIIFPGKLTKLLKFWPGLFAFQFILKTNKTQ